MTKKESLSRIMFKSSSIVFSALIITRFFGFLFNSLLTKNITQEEYGGYAFAWTIAQMGVGILLLGIGHATSYYIAFNRGRGDLDKAGNYKKTGFILVVILSAISVLGIFIINYFFPSLFSLSKMLLLFLTVMFVIHGIGFFFSLVINGYRKPEIGFIFAAVTPIASCLSIIFLILLHCSFYAILVGIVFSLTLQYILCAVYVFKNWGIGGRFKINLVKDLIKYGIPMVFMDVSSGFLWWAGMYAIKYYGTFADIGLFWAANTIPGIMFMFPQAILSIFSPVVSELFGKGDKEKIRYISSYIIERILMLSLPLIAVLILLPKEILRIVFTKDYSSGALLMQFLVLSAFLTGFYIFFATVINSSGNPKQNSKIMFAGAISNLIFSIILVKYFGITGGGMASLISSGIILTLSFNKLKKIIRLIPKWGRISKIILAILTALPFIFIIKMIIVSAFLRTGLSFATLTAVYLGMLIILKVFEKEDVILIRGITGETKLGALAIKTIEKGIL